MTKKEIEEMVMEGTTGEYSHFIIYCDHWDYSYGSRYVKYGEDINKIIANIKSGGSPGMFTIEEVYNYNLDLKKQIRERKAYHIEPIIAAKNNIVEKEISAIKNEDTTISENLNKAIQYAISMHEGQYRRDGTPYIKHPLNVAKNILNYKKSKNLETLLISACLHDVLEDTNATYYDIVQNFGPQVASIVLEVTTDEDMKNALGKEHYLGFKMKKMSSWALAIKLCDRLDNISDLESCNDTCFKNKYIDETIGIVDYLTKSRKLSKTHITILEQIIYVLTKLSTHNIDRTKKLNELRTSCENLKLALCNSSEIFNQLKEFGNNLNEYNKGVASKKLLL